MASDISESSDHSVDHAGSLSIEQPTKLTPAQLNVRKVQSDPLPPNETIDDKMDSTRTDESLTGPSQPNADDHVNHFPPPHPQHVVPDPDILKQLDMDTQLQMQNRIGYRLMYSAHFWIRIFILILNVILFVLSLSYAFGAVSSTELVLIQQCPGYSLETIWNHSQDIHSSTGVQDPCWSTSTIAIDQTNAYESNRYRYNPIHNDLAIVQCIVFSLFTFCCASVLIYGLYSLISDIIAVHQQCLYQKSRKFKRNHSGLRRSSITDPHSATGLLSMIRSKYDLYFGLDKNGAILKMILMETVEIVMQSFALLLYNGYNVFDPNEVVLAYKPQFIYLFVSILSLNCIGVGILWSFYALTQNKVNGLVFKMMEFGIDQFCDLFYTAYPFVVVFGDTYNKFDHNDAHPIWIAFGLLNNKTMSSFVYSAFPMLLLCSKSFSMTRSASAGMRDSSYELWVLVTRIMSAPDHDNAANVIANALGFTIQMTATDVTDGKTRPDNSIDDEIYDGQGNLKLNASKALLMVPKSVPCRISIGLMGALFIIYSIVLLSTVIGHLVSSVKHCDTLSLNVLTTHPELFVYSQCLYKVYPFSFSDDTLDNCQCRVVTIRWERGHITIPDEYIEANITRNSVLDGVLRRWTMLEKFSTVGHLKSSRREQIFEWRPEHFMATSMKLFSWSDVDMLEMDDAISNWMQLEFFEMQRVNNISTLPSTFAKLIKLKAFMITDVENFNISLEALLCGSTDIMLITIRNGKIASIPQCIAGLSHLQRFAIQNNLVTAFPLELLNVSSLSELDLWRNEIKYQHILTFNNLSNDSDPFQYYEAREGFTVFLNGNPICALVDIHLQFKIWADEQQCCTMIDCVNEQRAACSPSLLGNGQCDTLCNQTNCYMDGGDCYQYCFTETECNYTQFRNEECDEACNNPYCFWDNGYCSTETVDPTPSPTQWKPSKPTRWTKRPTVEGNTTMQP
eukprot:1004179_1